MGLERNLTAGEIVGQVLYAARDNGLWADWKRINIVMMGQGEPLLNVAEVLKAARILTDAKGLGLSPRRITVSTAGIVPRIAEFGQAPDSQRPRLAISLNASSEEHRCRLMPITRKWHLKDLLDACPHLPVAHVGESELSNTCCSRMSMIPMPMPAASLVCWPISTAS